MPEYNLELRFNGALLAQMQGPYPELAATAISMEGMYNYNRLPNGIEMWTNDTGYGMVLRPIGDIV